MKKLLFIVSTLCFTFWGYSQTDVCAGYFGSENEPKIYCENSPANMSYYRHQSSYIPGTNPFVDEVVVPINIIVLADGEGNYGAYTPETWENGKMLPTDLIG